MQGEQVVTGCDDRPLPLLLRGHSQWLDGVDAEWFENCVELCRRHQAPKAPAHPQSTQDT